MYDLGSGDGAEKSHWVEVSSRALKCLLLRGLDHEFYFSILLGVSSFEVTNSYFSMIVYAYLQKHLFKP